MEAGSLALSKVQKYTFWKIFLYFQTVEEDSFMV